MAGLEQKGPCRFQDRLVIHCTTKVSYADRQEKDKICRQEKSKRRAIFPDKRRTCKRKTRYADKERQDLQARKGEISKQEGQQRQDKDMIYRQEKDRTYRQEKGQIAGGGGARTHDRKVLITLRIVSLCTVPPTPQTYRGETNGEEEGEEYAHIKGVKEW
ncbi:hypothetical protein PoB_007611800 [Plakobranchus ocellatus]|uniref:Uncharacterized protein n=1 Tax=Plakobranchus ocellatus TaxID=259542 RepID=A0AAV4DZS5_9GAST|nr:hypothetical protein PoB_007611800 [Plakobranchus ocellatus]